MMPGQLCSLGDMVDLEASALNPSDVLPAGPKSSTRRIGCRFVAAGAVPVQSLQIDVSSGCFQQCEQERAQQIGRVEEYGGQDEA